MTADIWFIVTIIAVIIVGSTGIGIVVGTALVAFGGYFFGKDRFEEADQDRQREIYERNRERGGE